MCLLLYIYISTTNNIMICKTNFNTQEKRKCCLDKFLVFDENHIIRKQ